MKGVQSKHQHSGKKCHWQHFLLKGIQILQIFVDCCELHSCFNTIGEVQLVPH